jgi:hypothetical protein
LTSCRCKRVGHGPCGLHFGDEPALEALERIAFYGREVMEEARGRVMSFCPGLELEHAEPRAEVELAAEQLEQIARGVVGWRVAPEIADPPASYRFIVRHVSDSPCTPARCEGELSPARGSLFMPL